MVVMRTGDEPPRGYEEYLEHQELKAKRAGLTSSYALSSQLAQIEISELRTFYEKHNASATSYAGATPRLQKHLHFEFGLHLTPIGRTATDMVVMRAYDDGVLVGYAYAIYGWPKPEVWVIDYLLVDPLGTDDATAEDLAALLVDAIVQVAARGGLERTVIIAVTGDEETDSFWINRGFAEYTRPFSRHFKERIRRIYRLEVQNGGAQVAQAQS